jgi:hypothetical protein
MSTKINAAHAADEFRAAYDLPAAYSHLVCQAVAAALPPDQLVLAASGDPDAISLIGRAIAVEEGYLIEASIAEAAKSQSDHLILTGLKLPVLQEAINLVNRHQPDQVRELSVDAEGRPVQSYFPDLVVVNRSARTGIVVDIKRSLAGYGGSGKLNELRTKMQAAALSLPDILWRDHKRTYVDQVGSAIVDASRTQDDLDGGLWSLAGLDSLLGCAGAGEIAKSALKAFRETVKRTWVEAMMTPASPFPAQADQPPAQEAVKRGRGRPRKDESRPVQVSLFRPGKHPLH